MSWLLALLIGIVVGVVATAVGLWWYFAKDGGPYR